MKTRVEAAAPHHAADLLVVVDEVLHRGYHPLGVVAQVAIESEL